MFLDLEIRVYYLLAYCMSSRAPVTCVSLTSEVGNEFCVGQLDQYTTALQS